MVPLDACPLNSSTICRRIELATGWLALLYSGVYLVDGPTQTIERDCFSSLALVEVLEGALFEQVVHDE